MAMKLNSNIKVAVLVSGSGSNLQAIIDASKNDRDFGAEVVLVISNILKVNKDSYIDKLKNYMEETKALNKKLEEYEKDKALSNVDELIKNAKQVGNLNVVIKRFKDIDVDSLRTLADAVRDKLDNVVIVFATENEGKINLLTAVSKNAITKTMQAGKIVKEVAKIVGGGGGGRPDMAMAGGKDATKIDEALNQVEDIVKNLL